jgi:hypothetical protein
LKTIDLLVTGNASVRWELVLGQAISGTTTFADLNANYSCMESNSLGAVSGNPGIIIDSGWVTSSNTVKGVIESDVPMKYPITLNAAGQARGMGTLSLLVTGIGAASACRAAMTWKEIR